MASGKMSSFLNFFKLDDEYDDEYEEDRDSYEEQELDRQKNNVKRNSYENAEDMQTKQRGFLNSKPKVVPMNRNMMEVNIIKPTSFEDAEEICDTLLSSRPVVVNLEGLDPDEAQRIMDFTSGCVYAIRGQYHQISKYIFIFTPENVDISGDSISIDGEDIAAAPTIRREF